jgi:hypothetical protein
MGGIIIPFLLVFFLLLLDFPLGELKGPKTFLDLDGLLVGLIFIMECSPMFGVVFHMAYWGMEDS